MAIEVIKTEPNPVSGGSLKDKFKSGIGSAIVSSGRSIYVSGSSSKDSPLSISPIGTPVFDRVILSYQNEAVELTSVIVSISQTKNIVETALSDRNGTVKELINSGDHSVIIEGQIISDSLDLKPTEVYRKLVALTKINDAIEIVSGHCLDHDIQRIVVKRVAFPQREGFWNSLPFKIEALSDEVFDLEDLNIE